MFLTSFIITALAVYGMSTLIAEYDGPFDIFKKVRGSTKSSLFTCVVCIACWLAIPVTLLGLHVGILWLMPLAVIGAITFGERL